VCLPAGPFATATLRFEAVGGGGADCAQRYNSACSASGDHVDRVVSNGLVFPPELGDAGLADGGFYLELDRAVTTYGGVTSYDRDLSEAAPLLGGGKTTFRLTLQNGCSQGGWAVSASLHLVPGPWPAGAFSEAAPGISYTRVGDDADAGEGWLQTEVQLAAPLHGAQLLVFATGHNSAGQACEEFCPGDAVAFALDGVDAGVFAPTMGARDPSCVAGCDGCVGCPGGCASGFFCSAASGCCEASGVAREGWCPGEPSPPVLLPLGDLSAGAHTLTFTSPGAVTTGGYWLVSANLVAP
jgi:hypothetical protein